MCEHTWKVSAVNLCPYGWSMLQQAFYVLLQQSIGVQNVCFMSIMSNLQVFYEKACLMFFAQGVLF